jgi:hypothetical protein
MDLIASEDGDDHQFDRYDINLQHIDHQFDRHDHQFDRHDSNLQHIDGEEFDSRTTFSKRACNAYKT